MRRKQGACAQHGCQHLKWLQISWLLSRWLKMVTDESVGSISWFNQLSGGWYDARPVSGEPSARYRHASAAKSRPAHMSPAQALSALLRLRMAWGFGACSHDRRYCRWILYIKAARRANLSECKRCVGRVTALKPSAGVLARKKQKRFHASGLMFLKPASQHQAGPGPLIPSISATPANDN